MNTLQDALVFVFNADQHEVERLQVALTERRKLLRASETHEALATLRPGDIATMHGIRPQYLNGVRVKVVQLRKTKILVELDYSNGVVDGRAQARFGTLPFVVPASSLTASTSTP